MVNTTQTCPAGEKGYLKGGGEKTNGDREKLAVKAMEEIEEEKLMEDIAEMLEEKE